MAALKSGWQNQTKHFGHTHASQYSNLIFDNRGIGESDKPLRRYSTYEMACDTVELIDQLGWTEPRQLHVVGVSMGGMIAQELVKWLCSHLPKNSYPQVWGFNTCS